ncbi:hypothetical protein DFH27DRAFT_526066 [Peziza echinospora]|nr:hypothetical protein DFH27DRAFT_526066 [Peziza echinospora]
MSTRPTALLLLLTLLAAATTVLAQDTTIAGSTPIPTFDPVDPATPPPVDPNDTTGWSVVIIDKQWTQLFIGCLPLIFGTILVASLYQFIWCPWWAEKMKSVEKEWEKLEKERLGR